MNPLWWMLLGLAAGVLIMLPIARLLLRRAEHRARLAERRARDAERLAELGSMTGGLAHEIKNPLSTISLNAQLLIEALGDAPIPAAERTPLMRRLESLAREVDRLRDILRDFLQYAGRIKLDPQPHDLGLMVDALCDFLHPQCDQAGIVLRADRPRQRIESLVDEGLLKQSILNLMLNAMQAMSDPSGVPPPASTNAPATAGPRHQQPGEPATAPNTGRNELILRLEADDAEARIHVIDTGPGIPPERVEEIFRPYVSFKSGGTGLGLPTARRIVEEHGGRIAVHSEPGRGSDFTIHLPRSHSHEAGAGSTSA